MEKVCQELQLSRKTNYKFKPQVKCHDFIGLNSTPADYRATTFGS